LAGFLHAAANEALEIFLLRHGGSPCVAPRHTLPSSEHRDDTRSIAKADPGVFPPLPLEDPRWGRIEEVGRGSPPSTTRPQRTTRLKEKAQEHQAVPPSGRKPGHDPTNPRSARAVHRSRPVRGAG